MITLELGEAKLLGGISLRIATQNTTMQVTYDPIEIATEQFKAEETQRIFGIILIFTPPLKDRMPHLSQRT